MADEEITEEGRRARYEYWEQLGLDRVKHDLLNGGYQVVGGGPKVKEMAWEWVRLKEALPVRMNAAYDIEAAKAVYAAIEHLVAAGKRAHSISVPEEATRILVGQGAGTIGQAAASRLVREAYIALAQEGKIEAYAEAWRDWLIKAPLEQGNETMPVSPNTKVFIVHGHDDGTKETVARFVEKLGFEAIILHERANKGRTIITKFREETAGVGFAVVLMTPDDEGKAKDQPGLSPRARQNVVFELGFFIGALGLERVAAAVKGYVERPSDFDGVVYISLDSADWRTKLGTELKAAGFVFDWNKVLGS